MAKKVPLGNGQFAIVDDEDFDLVNQYVWQCHKGGGKYGERHQYAVTRLRMHRLVMNCPKGMVVDHINGDTLDNRKSNLRICTNAENQQNTNSRGGTSKFKGVSFSTKKKRWKGCFMWQGKVYYVGSFDNEEEAARAVDRKRREVCGGFSKANLWYEEES